MTTRHMIPRLVAALPMISFWLIFFLWGNNGNDDATQTTTTITMVEAFSTPPIATGGGASATTWATRTRQLINTQQQQPHTGSSSSLTAWRSSCPKVGKDGLYHITTEEEFRSLLEENPDKLVVLKVFSTWCKTCKALAPKFRALARRLGNGKNCAAGSYQQKLPIVWVNLAHSKENGCFVRHTLGARAVPSIVLYSGNGVLEDCFACGPSKVATVLQPKLVNLISNHVDLSTGTLKTVAVASAAATHQQEQRHGVQGWPIQPSFARRPLEMIALLCQILRSKLLKLVEVRTQHKRSTNNSDGATPNVA